MCTVMQLIRACDDSLSSFQGKFPHNPHPKTTEEKKHNLLAAFELLKSCGIVVPAEPYEGTTAPFSGDCSVILILPSVRHPQREPGRYFACVVVHHLSLVYRQQCSWI